MKRILVINPNTSAHVTEMVVASCRLAHPGMQWDGATARLGASYISSESAYAIAAHAALDAYAEHFAGHDAVLIACFGDPGLLALRELAPVPVVGLAQASFEAAQQRGPFAVVTGGKAWGPMLERFARMHQLDARLVGVHTVDLTGAQIAEAPERAHGVLFDACGLGQQAGAGCIVLGGAALAGMAATLQPRLAIPLLDNVLLGAQAVVEAALRPPSALAPSDAPRIAVKGLSAALTRLLV
jgi:Asp/Glu/hydantoin racemase